MKKHAKKVKAKYIALTTATITVIVILLSIGWAAFNSTLNVESYARARIKSEIRVTGFSVDSTSGTASSAYEDYNVSYVTAQATLPNSNSTVTYEVEITNMQLQAGVTMGIFSATGLPSELAVLSWSGYNLKDKICDDVNTSMCGTGATKTFLITIGYKDAASYTNRTNDDFNFVLNFDFRPFHSITYDSISGNYPSEIIDGDDLDITLSNVTTLQLQVSGTNIYTAGTDYTYNNNRLQMSNVTEDITITKLPIYTVTYNANGGTFDNSATTNPVVYQWINNSNVIIQGTVKTPTSSNGTFDGWYNDQAHTSLFDATAALSADKTVYAKWTSGGSQPVAGSAAAYILNLINTDPNYANYLIADDGTSDGNTRYYINNPNNYVYILPNSGSTRTEYTRWRIMGVFNNVDDGNGNLETRVKVFRMTANSYKRSNIISTINSNNNFLSPYVGQAKHYYGGITSTSQLQSMSANDIYEAEKNSNLYETVTLATITLSDYAFAGYDCVGSNTPVTNYSTCGGSAHNMLYRGGNSGNWTLNKNGSTLFYQANGGNITSITTDTTNRNTLITAYLKADVKITSGNGTQNSPYQLSLT